MTLSPVPAPALDARRALLCIPTPRERARLAILAPDVVDEERWLAVETVGFGPVAAAARAGALLARHRPERVVLIGAAGGQPEHPAHPGGLAVGAAARFGAVAIDGLGAGEGASLVLPSAMGLAQWDAADGAPIHERLPLADEGPLLLTVCAAADGRAMVESRSRRFPDAAAEDMEAFGVALAAHLAGVPLHVVRGASNVAGDRHHAGWRIDDALAAAAALLRESIEPHRGAR